MTFLLFMDRSSELCRRDPGGPFEVLTKVALVRKTDGGGDGGKGLRALLQQLLRPLNPLLDDVPVRGIPNDFLNSRAKW
jgi:hypothetical protein